MSLCDDRGTQAEWAKFNEWVNLDRRGNCLETQTTVNSRQAGGWDAAAPAMPLGVIRAHPAPANHRSGASPDDL